MSRQTDGYRLSVMKDHQADGRPSEQTKRATKFKKMHSRQHLEVISVSLLKTEKN